MSENREEILADFQACTGVEDVGEAIFHLEESNWDLLAAVNRVMPQETQALPSEMDSDIQMVAEVTRKPSNQDSDISYLESCSSNKAFPAFKIPLSVGTDLAALPSTSNDLNNSSVRKLHFHIHFGERIVQFQIEDNLTVGDLKNLIAGRLGVLPCQQDLQGWKNYPKSDSNLLKSLDLPRDNTLALVLPDQDGDEEMIVDEPSLADRLQQSYTLKIQFGNKNYDLQYSGSKTILEIKNDVYSFTNIPVRLQNWTGWPKTVKSDKIELANAGLTQPVLRLIVKAESNSKDKKVVVDITESEDEEFEDASESFNVEDDIFVDVETKKIQSLIPPNIEDETAGCIHFIEEFTNRYGHSRPDFFPGTLDEAIKEACHKPAKNRRLLAMYLHQDSSVLANVFCTQLLCFETVLQHLNSHFITWGWDLTHETNRQRLLTSVSRTLGSVAALTIRNIEADHLPALIIIMRLRSNTEIFTVVQGNVGVSELLSSLINAVEIYSDQRRTEVREESDREARELVKREQDAAYQESLQADRAKEEARKREAEAQADAEQKRREEEETRETLRKKVEADLPPEPESGESDITRIRFRLPQGESLDRRFRTDQTLEVLLNFLLAKGYPQSEYKVISSWPRRDLTILDSNATLQDLKLCPQETVILEER